MSSKMMQTRGRKASLPGCHRFRLVVEELEFRWVPSTFLWDPPQADRNWTAHENSRKYDNLLGWLGTNNVPGANDDVEFKGEWEGDFGTYEANKPCIIDQAVIVKSIKMYPDYSSTLYLQSELRIDRALWMLGPGHISGYPINGQVNRGPLITDGLFEWRDGTLINVTVEDKGILTVDSISTPEMSSTCLAPQQQYRVR